MKKKLGKNEKKKVLVTGGAGFIGSHLCEKLLQEDAEVFCVDNLFTGSKKNLHLLEKDKNFHFLEKDVCEPFSVGEISEIYNLACPASPKHYQKDPIKTLKTSVFGILQMLELAKKYKAKIFHASTSEVYGDPEVHPQKESYVGHVNPIGPRACYDEGKRCAETFCFDYARKYGVKIKVARIFNTYGPRMHPDDGRVVSNFIVQALKNEPITIYGDGMQTRSFCYVEDLVEGILLLMKSPDEFLGPVNLGNPSEWTMIDLAKKVLTLTKSSSELEFQKLPEDDPKKRKPDISLAKKMLHWEPKKEVESGLKETILYFQKSINSCK